MRLTPCYHKAGNHAATEGDMVECWISARHLQLEPQLFDHALVLSGYPLRVAAEAAVRFDLGLAFSVLDHALQVLARGRRGVSVTCI